MSHYKQYKETIKEVTKRNYRKRVIWVNEFLANQSCCHCGERETACLQFYPHDSKIRSLSKRTINHCCNEIPTRNFDVIEIYDRKHDRAPPHD